VFATKAQNIDGEGLFTDSVMLPAKSSGVLLLNIDNISFLNNNENDGRIQHGYTLPGFRLTPRMVYQPIDKFKLECGLSLLRFWGADRYPNYAYKGIPEAKADSYQIGFHLLPFFRAQVQLSSKTTVVLGNIYGGSNHGLIEPLYNYELNLIADPEAGAQIVHRSRYLHLDSWVNWETFMFNNQEELEAMTFGLAAKLNITSPESTFHVGIPVQSLVHHLGGELDNIKGNVTTQADGATGFVFRLNPRGSVFRFAELKVMGAGYKCLTDKEEPRGWAFFSGISAQTGDFNMKVNYWHSGNFVNLFGNSIFGNFSTSREETWFPRTTVINPGIRYERLFGRGVHFGAYTDIFYNPHLTSYIEKIYFDETKTSFSWTCGLFIRVNPEIFLN
jgi:hypothetical protein